MDLRQLEILQAIAETGSFTACGRKLHVSQSAISRQIALLEEELGEPLFLRVGRKVRMTPAADRSRARPARVSRRPRHRRERHRPHPRAQRDAASVGRHDRLPLHLSDARQAAQTRASEARRPHDGRHGRPLRRGNPRRPRRRGPPDAAGRGSRPRHAARAARGTPARDDARACAGEEEEGHGAGSRRRTVRAVRGRLGHAPCDRSLLLERNVEPT